MWKTVKLGSLIDVVMGQAPPGKSCNKNGIGTPFVKAGEFTSYSPVIREWTTEPKKIGETGDVFLCVVGATCGKINFGEDCAIGRSVAALRPLKDKIEQKYLYYFMLLMVQVLRAGSLGAAQTVISKDMINNITLSLPPLAEQQRIVAKLDAAVAEIDKAITAKQKQVENAEMIFGNFIEKLMEADGDAMSLDDLSLSITDGDHQPPPKSKSGVPFITISNVNKQTRKIDFQNTFFVPESYYSNLKQQRKPKRGDILYTVTGSFGIPVLIDEDMAFCFQRHIAIIRPNKNVLSKWLYYALLSASVFRQADKNATGAAQRTVSLKTLRSIKVNVPTLEKQRQDCEKIKLIEERTEQFLKTQREALEAILALKSAILARELQSKAA
jgi:type I restriction enzyme, S subunit